MGVYGTTWLESAQPFLEKNLPIPPRLGGKFWENPWKMWGGAWRVCPNGWFIMDNPSKMDDLGVPRILGNLHVCFWWQFTYV